MRGQGQEANITCLMMSPLLQEKEKRNIVRGVARTELGVRKKTNNRERRLQADAEGICK